MDPQLFRDSSGDDFFGSQEFQLPDDPVSSWAHAQEAAHYEREYADIVALVQRFHPEFPVDDAPLPEYADAGFHDCGNSSFPDFMNNDHSGTLENIGDIEDGNATEVTQPDVNNFWPRTIAAKDLAGGFTGDDSSGLESSPDHTSTASMDTSVACLTPMSPSSIFTPSPDAVFSQPAMPCLTVEPHKLMEPTPVIFETPRPQPMGSNGQATTSQPEGSSRRRRKRASGKDKSGPKKMSMREFRRITKPEQCPYCPNGKQFTRDLDRHLRKHEKQFGLAVPRFPCNYPGCTKSYAREDYVKRHADHIHPGWYVESGKKGRRRV